MNFSHDTFVRGFLSDPQIAIDFFTASLPPQLTSLLSIENLELTKDTFIGKKSKESRSDLLFKVPLKNIQSSVYIYLLFEHKSYYDPKIYIQLLEYLAKIYSHQQKNKENLQVVIPFVFYHGQKEWDLGDRFLDSFNTDSLTFELIRYIPNFSIQLLELKSDGEEFHSKNLALRLYMRMIQIIRDSPDQFKPKLKGIFRSLKEEKDFPKRVEILENLAEYLFRARKDAADFTEKEIINEIEDEYMNLLERIREEGKIEGFQKGEEKGELKNAIATARKLQEEGDSLEKIIRITGLTEIQLKENGMAPD
jgi:predicted transposase/invertase (TIGR01784 family)